MSLYYMIENYFIEAFFNSQDIYNNFLLTDSFGTKLIQFIIQVLSFGIPLGVLLFAFIFLFHTMIKLFKRVINEINTNVMVSEERKRRK